MLCFEIYDFELLINMKGSYERSTQGRSCPSGPEFIAIVSLWFRIFSFSEYFECVNHIP